MQSFLDYFSSNRDRFITEWRELLAFKSISADPAFHNDCLECAAWLSRHLEGLGFKTEIWPSDTKPLIYGVLPGNPNRPVILFYGHYDVQPVDPLNLWITPPFEPTLRDGRMYARGAQDNKGQLFYFLKALEALKVTGADLPTIKVIIEGEEECGSEAMHAGLAQWEEPLKSDILMVCDTGVIAAGVPTITMGLRGIAHCELRVHGPRIDLHSGVYGGVVLNPLQALSSILAGLHAPDGSVAVPGFYNGVKAPHAEDRELAAKAPIDTDAISAMLGVSLEGGEHGLHPLERRGFRPTLEINGVGGGYQGAGGKTVIPAYGMAKLSMRLVDGQDPDEILATVVRHLQGAAPKGTRVEIHDESVGGPAIQLSTKSSAIQTASKALRRAFDREPVYIWEGASIPIVTKLAVTAGAQPLLVGFGQEEDMIHAPNESSSLKQFEEGYRYVTSFLGLV